MLQADRRRDPYPFTFEIPLAAVAITLTLAGLGVHAGRAVTYWRAGAGWQWPPSQALLASIPGVLTGHPAAGLDPVPAITASSGVVLGWIVTIEAVLVLVLFAGTILILRQWGPGRLKGMATAAEAEATLGLARLRKHRHIVRPDLHPPRHRRSRP